MFDNGLLSAQRRPNDGSMTQDYLTTLINTAQQLPNDCLMKIMPLLTGLAKLYEGKKMNSRICSFFVCLF